MENIFTLTKREQRIVIVIVSALIAGTIATHYRYSRSSSDAPTNQPSATPIIADQEEGRPAADDSP